MNVKCQKEGRSQEAEDDMDLRSNKTFSSSICVIASGQVAIGKYSCIGPVQAHLGHTQPGTGTDTGWHIGNMDGGTQIHRQMYTSRLVAEDGKRPGL